MHGTNSAHSTPCPIVHTKHTENNPHHHVNSLPQRTNHINFPPLHMHELTTHMLVGNHGLSTGRHTQPPPTHRLGCPVTSLTELVLGSPHAHSPHPPKRATGVPPAPSPISMYIEYMAIGKHRWCISAAPTPHTARHVPLCTQNTGNTTPTTTSTAYPIAPTSPLLHMRALTTRMGIRKHGQRRKSPSPASHTPTCAPNHLPHRACVRERTRLQSTPSQATHRWRASSTTHAHAH